MNANTTDANDANANTPPRACSPARRSKDCTEKPLTRDTCLLADEVRLILHLYNRYYGGRHGIVIDPPLVTDTPDGGEEDGRQQQQQQQRSARSRSAKRSRGEKRRSARKGNDMTQGNDDTDEYALRALQALRERLGTPAGREDLWFDMPFVTADPRARAYLKGVAFRPSMPRTWRMHPHEWLNNQDIHAVLAQYERRLPDFAFAGAHAIDFDTVLEDGLCVAIEMCALDVAALRLQGKRHIGVVLNTDKHYERGSHWTAVYANIDPSPSSNHFGVFFYDSIARPPPAEVLRLYASLRDQVRAQYGPGVARRFSFDYNRVRRQYQDTECGLFAIMFLICCVSGRFSCQEVCHKMGLDEHVHELRAKFFRPPA